MPLKPSHEKQQTLTKYHQTTKSGSNHHHAAAQKQNPFEALMQKGRMANKINSGHQSTDHSRTPDNYHKSALQEANEARRKAAAAAEDRQRLSALNKEPTRTTNKKQEQQGDESRAENQAWRDRALATRKTSLTKVAKRAPASSSILSKLSADAKRERDRRARALKDRNERMHAAAAAEDAATKTQTQREAERNHALSAPKAYESIRAKKAFDEITNAGPEPPAAVHAPFRQSHTPERENSPTAEPSLRHLDRTTGPFPANSTPGVEALKKSMPQSMVLPYDDLPSTTAAKRFMGNKPKVSFKKSKANLENQPITANDLQIYQWRQQKRKWAEVIQLYTDLGTNTPRGEEYLRARFRRVEKALICEEISEELCDQVLNGDEVAERELNRLADLQGSEPSSRMDSAVPMAFKKITKKDRAIAVPSMGLPPAPRPTQGGKTLDNDTYLAYLNQSRDAWVEGADDEEDLPRYSPPRESDCVHWEYFMQRRDFAASDLAEHGYEMLDADIEWREFDAAFGSVGEANAEASGFVFTVLEGSETLDIFEEGQLRWKRTKEEGMIAYDLTSPAGGGLVQVRVARRMLTFQDHVMPESKEGWTPRTVYCVWVKTCKKPAEDLFEEPEANIELLDENGYGSLEQANSRAMDEWIRLTVKIRSVNLDEIARKRGEIKEQMQRKFDEESEGTERARFKASMDDDERTVEVFVKPLSVQGPRN